jgi:hypothetical protein
MNNPPAFPTSHEEPDDYNGHNNSKKTVIDQGMSLRDYMAAKAMQGFLSNDNLLRESCKWHKDGSETSIAVLAYDQADAMMKVREA